MAIIFWITLANVVVDGSLDPPVSFGTSISVIKFLTFSTGDEPIFLTMTEENRDRESIETIDRAE